MQNVVEVNKNSSAGLKHDRLKNVSETKIGIFGKLFGCWHKRLTRPFADDRSSYQACLECGARRKFDLKNFKTSGAFYFPQSVTFDRN